MSPQTSPDPEVQPFLTAPEATSSLVADAHAAILIHYSDGANRYPECKSLETHRRIVGDYYAKLYAIWQAPPTALDGHQTSKRLLQLAALCLRAHVELGLKPNLPDPAR